MKNGFPVHDLDSAPAGSKQTLAAVAKVQGYLPALPAVMAESPLALQTFLSGLEAFSKSHFTALEKEVIFLTIDVENRCSYCVAFHSFLATRIEMNPADLKALRAGQNPADPRLSILSETTRSLVRNKGAVSPELLGKFLQAGYTHENILEILVAWSSQVISNSLNHLVDAPPEKMFQDYAWKGN